MSDIPDHLRDAKERLTAQGFTTGDTWYHGTSSALVDSIKKHGLKRSGDKTMKQAAKQTMATIGNDYTESIEPVFLTQSKEIAYFWAKKTVRDRSVRLESAEEPIVLQVSLPDELNSQVKPDVGAVSLLMIKEGEHYIAHIAAIYEKNEQVVPEIDLMKADRMDFLNKLGMAYYNQDIAPEFVSEA